MVASLTYGQGLLITDCQGFTRALKSVDPGSPSRVEIRVTEPSGAPAQNANVTLTNSVTGQVQTVQVQNGLAVFENVPAGTFSVATEASGLSISTVSVGPMGFSTLAAGSAAVGAGAGGTGAVVGTGVVVNDTVINNPNEPEATPTPAPTPTPEPEATPQPPPIPTPVPTEECDVCDEDATPQPTDPFAPTNPAVISPHR